MRSMSPSMLTRGEEEGEGLQGERFDGDELPGDDLAGRALDGVEQYGDGVEDADGVRLSDLRFLGGVEGQLP